MRIHKSASGQVWFYTSPLPAVRILEDTTYHRATHCTMTHPHPTVHLYRSSSCNALYLCNALWHLGERSWYSSCSLSPRLPTLPPSRSKLQSVCVILGPSMRSTWCYLLPLRDVKWQHAVVGPSLFVLLLLPSYIRVKQWTVFDAGSYSLVLLRRERPLWKLV